MTRSGLAAAVSLAVVFLVIAGGCSSEEEPLVVYVSADEYVARPVLKSFTQRTGVPVHLVGDTEATKTTGLVDRLRAETDQPVADVFWSSEAFLTVDLARDGVLQAHRSPTANGWPAQWRDSQQRWFGFSPRPRVLVTNPRMLVPSEVPVSLMQLTEPRWQGQIVMADPRFGTTGGHLAALSAWYAQVGDTEGFQQLLDGLSRNQVHVLPGGNAAVVDYVRSGQALIGLTDADDVRAANRLDAGLEMHTVGPVEGVGTFLMPNTVALVAGSDHPRAGDLVDFLLSEQVARALAESTSGNVPLLPEVAADYPHLVVADPMPVDLEEAAEMYPSAVTGAVVTLKQEQPSASP